jgi:hypothetical protein
MLQDVTMGMTYALSILKELPNGGREAELEFLANEMEISMAGQTVMSFDSKQNSKNDEQNQMAGPFRKILGSKVRLQYDASGKIDQVVGYEEWAKRLQGDVSGPIAGLLSHQFNEGFIRQVSSFGVGLPEKPTRVGETWPLQLEVPAGPMGSVKIENTVTFKGFESHDQHPCAVLDFAGTIKGAPGQEAPGPMGKVSIDTGKVTGSSWFDAELGALIESAQDQVMRLNGEMTAQPNLPGGGVKYSIELGQRVTVKLVELGKTNSK